MSAKLGPYRVLEQVGQGGMGTVHRAEHEATGAVHALKVVSPSGHEDALRFLREAESMARVEGHPHVLRIHASGHEGGRLWLAMEWASGGSLAERLASGPLPVGEVISLGRALALGLAHVHTRGVLHRDLKPANVLYDAAGQPKLADFGLARRAGVSSLTQSGALVGTPAYMAPEQALGLGALDERVDVYGLGAVLYTALTGRAPFAAPSAMALLAMVATAHAPDPRLLRPDTPRWLTREVLRALSKSPDRRHPSAAALADALGGPNKASFPGARVGAAAVAVVILGVALIALARFGPSPSPSRPSPPVAEEPPGSRRPALPRVEDVEALLATGEAQQALDLSEAVSGDAARWAKVRALLLLGRFSEARRLVDGGALQRPHRQAAQDLLELEGVRSELELAHGSIRALRATLEGLAVDGLSLDLADPYASIGTALGRIRALARTPEEASHAGGAAGESVCRRLAATLALLFRELARSVRGDELTTVIELPTVVDALQKVSAAVPESPEGRALRLVTHWLRFTLGSGEPSPEDLQALLLARSDSTLAPVQRRLALLTTNLIGVDMNDDRATGAAEERLGACPDLLDPLADVHRRAIEELTERYALLAWREPPRRHDLMVRTLRLLEDVPDSVLDDGTARLRVIARLMSNLEPSEEHLGAVQAGSLYERILRAEVLLGRGEWRVAASCYQQAIAKVSSSQRASWTVDGWTGLALALAVGGDLAGSEVVLEQLTRIELRHSWLHWRDEAATARAIEKVRAGTWRPTRGQPFPPDQ